ncbi:hypothetical protein BC830DRAFT_1174948 [Chytriomyces sp. MP71]|nr:hypothetical protein BC830DRAFT_1174948 [Chytriomyces sp. MP71]
MIQPRATKPACHKVHRIVQLNQFGEAPHPYQWPFTVPPNKIMDLSKLIDNTFSVENDPAKPGVLDGQLYWDGKGGGGGVPKPLMFRINAENSHFKGFTLLNTPVKAMSAHGTNVTIRSPSMTP